MVNKNKMETSIMKHRKFNDVCEDDFFSFADFGFFLRASLPPARALL
jgi:hypothetical protein